MKRIALTAICLLLPVAALIGFRGKTVHRILLPSNVIESNAVIWGFDALSVNGAGEFHAEGYLAVSNEEQWYPQSNKSVWLYDPASETRYQLSTAEVNRGGIDGYEGEKNYSYCGFKCDAKLSELNPKDGAEYNILLAYQCRGSLYLVDTGNKLLFNGLAFSIKETA